MATLNPPRIIAVDLGSISAVAFVSGGIVRTQTLAAGRIAETIRAVLCR